MPVGYRIEGIKQTFKIYVEEKKILNSTYNIIKISNNEQSRTTLENLTSSSRLSQENILNNILFIIYQTC